MVQGLSTDIELADPAMGHDVQPVDLLSPAPDTLSQLLDKGLPLVGCPGNAAVGDRFVPASVFTSRHLVRSGNEDGREAAPPTGILEERQIADRGAVEDVRTGEPEFPQRVHSPQRSQVVDRRVVEIQ